MSASRERESREGVQEEKERVERERERERVEKGCEKRRSASREERVEECD